MTNGKSNINERLRKVDKNTASFGASVAMHKEDYKWMHDTIKQLQEDVRIKQELLDEYRRSNKEYIAALDTHLERIAELEKERREITAAHDAFLRDCKIEDSRPASFVTSVGRKMIEDIYNKHFQFIHLAEQVRLAKLSAGVDGE